MQAHERKISIDALVDISNPYDSRFKVQYSNPFEIGVFKGGGQKAVVYAGMLKYFEENGLVLPDIQEFLGTSAGGLTVGLLGLGYNSEDIKQLFAEEFNNMLSVHSLSDAVRMGVKGLPKLLSRNHFGLIVPEDVIPLLGEKVEEKLGNPNATFKDLDDYIQSNPNCGLRPFSVLGAEMSTGKVKVFGIETTPDIPIAHALYITMSCQPIFAPLEYQGLKYGDGGISANNPISFAEKMARDKGIPIESIFNARVDDTLTKKQLLGYETLNDYQTVEPAHFIDYLTGLTANQSNQDNQHGVVAEHRTIIMDNQGVGTFEIDFTEKMITALWDEGYQCAKKWHQNYMEDSIAGMEKYPTTYSKVNSLTKQEAKERANILAEVLCELDQYDGGFLKTPIYFSKTEVLDEDLRRNRIYIFEQAGVFKWIGRDISGKIFRGELSQLPYDLDVLNAIEEPLREGKELEEERTQINGDIKNLLLQGVSESIQTGIEKRKLDIAKEICTIQFCHNYFPLTLGSAVRYVDQAQQEINLQITKSLNKEDSSEILFSEDVTNLEMYLEEFDDIKAFDDHVLTREDTETRLNELVEYLKNVISNSQSLIQTGEFTQVLLQMKMEFFKDLKDCLSSMQDCLNKDQSEHAEFFKDEAFKRIETISSVASALNDNWFEALKEQLSSDQVDEAMDLAENQMAETEELLVTLKERMEQITEHYQSTQTLYFSAKKLLNQYEASPEAESLKDEIETLSQNLSHYIEAQRSLLNVIINFFCKLFKVKTENLPSDIYFLRQAEALKETVGNLDNSINENSTKEAILEKREDFENDLQSHHSKNKHGFFSTFEHDFKKYRRALNTENVSPVEDFQEEVPEASMCGDWRFCQR